MLLLEEPELQAGGLIPHPTQVVSHLRLHRSSPLATLGKDESQKHLSPARLPQIPSIGAGAALVPSACESTWIIHFVNIYF